MLLALAAAGGLGGCAASKAGASAADAAASPAPIDRTVTAGMIAGNPGKYAGVRVRIRCDITNVVGDDTANASCGPSPDELVAASTKAAASIDYTDPNATQRLLAAQTKQQAEFTRNHGDLVLHGAGIGDLDAQQRVIVTGTVTTFNGQTVAGGTRDFPAIEVDGISAPTKK